MSARAIKIAVTAMGGQGGGVLASWIVKLGERAGYVAQSTSVPGVAQRTGATVYYVELFPAQAIEKAGKPPILALMPASGDVDIVIAAEFMEAGRAIMRGFVSAQTILIASSHRDYAISEKIGLGDGRQGVASIREAAQKAAGRFIEADMAAAAAECGAMISAVMFGALAGSGALPISREVFEETIRSGERAVEANLRGFATGFDLATQNAPKISISCDGQREAPANECSARVAPLVDAMYSKMPPETHSIIFEGLKRCVDYQGVAYAEQYLEYLSALATIDKACGAAENYRLTNLAAKHLALWMTYEDSIRVADQKTRRARFQRFREDVKATDGQIVIVHEYLHPRVEEVCDILPASIARGILKGKWRKKILKIMLGDGRRVPTTKLRGFLQLWALSKLRSLRPASFRFSIEQIRIRQWLDWMKEYASLDYEFVCEVAAMQRLLKGYGDTYERGIGSYNRIMARIEEVSRQPNPAATLSALRDAALKDAEGKMLDAALRALRPALRVAE